MPRFPKIINDDGSYRYPVSPGDLAQNEIDDNETAEWDEEDSDDEEDDEEDDPYGVNRLRNIGGAQVQRNPLTSIHAKTRPTFPAFDTNLDNEDDIQRWEDADSYPIPPINMRDARDDYGGAPREYDDNAPAGNPQDEFDLGKPRTAAERYEAALNAKTSYESQMPRESEHKPKAWQRALAGVANFGAGYVNAGGRVRVDPSAMQNINQSLLRPGYQRDIQKWKEQGVGINSEIDAAGRAVQLESQKQRAELEARRAAAYEKAQGSQESYNRRREAKLDERPWHPSSTGHTVWRETEDGGVETKEIEAPKTPPPPRETPAEKTERLKKEAVDELGYKVGSDEYRAHLGDKAALEKIRAKNRPARVGKGGGSGNPNKTQFRMVEKDKAAALSKAEQAHWKRVQKDNVPESQSLQMLEDEKARIQSAYESGVSSLGGSIVPRPKQSPAAPPPQSKYKEAEVRQKAIQAGKDPEFVVAEMKKRGLL